MTAFTLVTEHEWWPCCACCDQGVTDDDQDRCYFNGKRDRHTGPCDECDKACPCCGDTHPKRTLVTPAEQKGATVR